MKIPKTFLAIASLVLCSLFSKAQQVYPAAVSSSGILLGKYKTADDATNAIPDSISLSDAKNIFALNAIYIDKEKKLQVVDIAEFELLISENGKDVTVKGNSSMLTKEMKDNLNLIHSGARIIFQGILVKFSNGDNRNLILLDFTVI